jgi:hypothetical protein
VPRREAAGWFVAMPGRVAGTSNACTDDNDMRQLIVMIEEGMATSRALGRRGAGGEGGADDGVSGYPSN